MLAAPPEVICIYYPSKALYLTADEASVALREIAILRMDRGEYDPRLLAYECHGHHHLGRPGAKKDSR